MVKINRPVSLENVISKSIYDDVGGWRDMTDQEQIENLEEIKIALLDTCRGNNSQIARAIKRMSPDNLPENIGIYRRLTKEGYTAGQSYPDEIRYIKDTIKRQC